MQAGAFCSLVLSGAATILSPLLDDEKNPAFVVSEIRPPRAEHRSYTIENGRIKKAGDLTRNLRVNSQKHSAARTPH